jgi:DNA-binding beta-propeller fold protein YncE
VNKQSRVCLVFVVFLATLILTIMVVGAQPSCALFTDEEITASRSSPPVGVDLDVTYISRAPLYRAYCVEYLYDAPNQPGRPVLCPGTENDRRWPEPGEIVTFTAHIINKGTMTSPAFDYAWYIDGVEVDNGTLPPLDPAAEVIATYQWPWTHDLSPDGQRALGEHTVRFTADPANAVAETYEVNNSLEDRTNAMSFRISITPEMYDVYNIPVDPEVPYSAEDWLQKQIAAMNTSFADAIYPATPQGAALRVRINGINVTPSDPGADGEHDGGWYIRDEVRCVDCGYWDPETDIDWGLVHELSHQVSIIDLYAIGVYASNVFVQGGNGMPANVGFGWTGGGLMGGGDISPYTEPNRYSSHTAAGASTYAGYRNGYYGSYLFDIPLQNYLRILDSQGNPAPGVDVTVYQRTGPWDWTGQMGVDSTPEISGTTDAQGVFPLPNRPANGGTTTANGHVMHDNPFGVVDIIGNQGLFLIQLVREKHEEFHWLDITQFNLAYWLGDDISHTFTISSHVPSPGAPAAPELLAVRVEGARASLDWRPSSSPGVVGYRVYRATAPQYRYVDASGLLTSTHFEEYLAGVGDGEHRIYAVTAVGAGGLESGFSELAYAPALGEPVALALTGDGARMVLNNWNMYPLLRQQSDGRYSHRLVNVHYDLDGAHHLAFDPVGRLLVSGFGEFPDGRFPVRVYDQELQPRQGFGSEGSAPGQFLAPAGIASWGIHCTYGGPYETDSHTLLLLHFDGEYAGVEGEMGTAIGTTFTDGHYGQGVLMDDTDTLTYTTAGNLDHTWGAVEFWIRPNWNGDDGGDHTLFWWGDDAGMLHLRKDPISNLVFDYFYAGGGCGAPTNVADWRAGEWHHLAFTWAETEIRLYVDGQQVDRSVCGGIAQPMAPDFHVGSWAGGARSIEATLDELRISDMPRVGNNEVCGRILVADSELHRIQAFDDEGNLLSAYGGLGSGAGQFNTPQGLVVDSGGRVVVADQGNNRLVVLSFDGTEFSYSDSFDAGLNDPSGLAVDSRDNLVVADTGNNRIAVLDREGNFLSEFTEPNDGYTGPFSAPRGVAVEPCGNLVVADTGNRRVVTVRGALPGCRTWLPLLSRNWEAR